MVDKDLDKVLSIFTEFMSRVSMLDELVDAGKRFLMRFNQEQVHNCMLGLQDYLKWAKASLEEIDRLADDAYTAVIETQHSASRFVLEHANNSFMNQTTCSEDQAILDMKEKPVMYATMMRVIFYMLNLDYMMQEKIVGCLSLNSSLSELETYCQMWDLRPYVDDSIRRHAWKTMSC